jgi:integrase
MRQGEAFGLQWQDIDFRNGFLEVRRTIGYRQGELLTGSPKNRKARRVDLPKALQQLLHQRNERAIENAALNQKAFCPWVFPNRAGQPLDASHFTSRVWRPLL